MSEKGKSGIVCSECKKPVSLIFVSNGRCWQCDIRLSNEKYPLEKWLKNYPKKIS